jgi:carbon storage regulator
MLVLSRELGQSLMIGDDVTLTFLSIDKHQIRLGIQAPRHISVHREEIYKRIQLEKTGTSNIVNQRTSSSAPAAELDDAEVASQSFNAAIDYAIDVARSDALIFLEMWREGDWESIASDFPDFDLGTTGQVKPANIAKASRHNR